MVLISNTPCPRLEVVCKGRLKTFLSYFSGKQQKNLDDISLSHNKAGVTASFGSHTLLQFQCPVRHAGDTPPPLFVCVCLHGVDIHTGPALTFTVSGDIISRHTDSFLVLFFSGP